MKRLTSFDKLGTHHSVHAVYVLMQSKSSNCKAGRSSKHRCMQRSAMLRHIQFMICISVLDIFTSLPSTSNSITNSPLVSRSVQGAAMQ